MGKGGILLYRAQGNSEYNKINMKKTDLEREGSRSRGKQPRSYVKVLKKDLSDKEVN